MTPVEPPIQLFEQEHARIEAILPPPNSDRDRADRRHLAWTIASDTELFISRDDALLQTCRSHLEDFHFEALRPSELLVRVDRLQNEARYNPARVSGAVSITSNRPQEVKVNEIAPLANTLAGEKARDLAQGLRALLSDPRRSHVEIIKNEQEVIACIGTKSQGPTSRIEFIRARSNSPYSATIISEMINRHILRCIDDNIEYLEARDALAGSDIEQALTEFSFSRGTDYWLKWSRRTIEDIPSISRNLERLPDRHQWLSTELRPALESATSDQRAHTRLEQILWPLKVTDAGAQNFVVPIRPQWAKELFDSEYSRIDLFGCDPSLMLRRENAYYRSASGICPPKGSRLLWYVSQHDGFPHSRAIRACSLVEEASVLPAREAFRRGRRFGIYKRTDVVRTAHGPDKPVMVIFFTGIEEFSSPQTFQKANEVLEDHGQAPNQFQTIVSISEPIFNRIYRSGMEID